MNPSSTASSDSIRTALGKIVLAKDGVRCLVTGLGPGEEISCGSDRSGKENVLFVIEGAMTVHVGALNFILGKEDALHIAPGKEFTLMATGPSWAKFLRVEFTPRVIVREPLHTFPD